jgi:hypothetical protein
MTRASICTSVRRTTIVIAVVSVAGASLLAGSALGSSSATTQNLRVLPEAFGPPVPLAVGAYRTRPGFAPVTTFTIGRGWHGAGSSRDWVVGKGWNASADRFRGAAIWVSRLSLRYATAVARFRALKTLEAGPSKPIRVGGYVGVVFRAKVTGEHAIIPSIAPGLDVVNTPGGQQIFLNVRGITLLLRVEARALASDAAAVQGFLRTVRFPR